jgi:hypothetical protein
MKMNSIIFPTLYLGFNLTFGSSLSFAATEAIGTACRTMVSGEQKTLDASFGHPQFDWFYNFRFQIRDNTVEVTQFYEKIDDNSSELISRTQFPNPQNVFRANENQIVVTGNEIAVFEYYVWAFRKPMFRLAGLASASESNLVVVRNRTDVSGRTDRRFAENTGAGLFRVVGEKLELLGTIGAIENPKVNRSGYFLSKGENFQSGRLSGDAKTFAGLNENGKVFLYDISERYNRSDKSAFRQTFEFSVGNVQRMEFSPDGKVFAMISPSGKIKVLSSYQGKWSQTNLKLTLKTGLSSLTKQEGSWIEHFKFGRTRYGTPTIEVKYNTDSEIRVYEL